MKNKQFYKNTIKIHSDNTTLRWCFDSDTNLTKEMLSIDFNWAQFYYLLGLQLYTNFSVDIDSEKIGDNNNE